MLAFKINRTYTKVKINQELRDAKITQRDMDRLTRAAHYVFVDIFGLTPKWDITFEVHPEGDYDHIHGVDPHSIAFAHWPDHYHTGTVGIRVDVLKGDLEVLVSVLIHEAIHLTMASLTDTLNESVPQRLAPTVNSADEEFVSEMTAIFFQQLRLSNIDKTLAS